jgi:hypothetical protein
VLGWIDGEPVGLFRPAFDDVFEWRRPLQGLEPLGEVGMVTAATYYPELRVLETEMKVDGTWTGHEAGQFAFVTTDWREGPLPYTIATASDAAERKIGFIAKELGADALLRAIN